MVEILTHPAAVLAQVAERGPAPSVVELLTHPAALGVVAPLVLAALVGIVAIIAVNWSKVRRAEFDATLKHDMLQRGMTADEIERVLRASQSSPCRPSSNLAVDATPSGVAALMAK